MCCWCIVADGGGNGGDIRSRICIPGDGSRWVQAALQLLYTPHWLCTMHPQAVSDQAPPGVSHHVCVCATPNTPFRHVAVLLLFLALAAPTQVLQSRLSCCSLPCTTGL